MSTSKNLEFFQKLPNSKFSRRKFTTRAVGLGLSAGALESFLQACGEAQSSSSANTTINLWHGWTGGDNTQTLNTVLKEFSKDQQGKESVNPTALPWDDLFSKWVTSFAAGNPPDVTMLHVSELPEYAKRGILRPIDDLVKSVGLDLTSVPPTALKGGQYNGQLYAVPGDLHPLGMYYNTDMVSAAGLDPKSPPTNQDELLHWADKLTIRDASGKVTQYGVYLPSTGATPRWLWFSLMYQFGGSFLGSDNKSDVNSQASQQALQFLVDLFHKYKVVTPGQTGQGIDPAAAKKAALWFIGPWEVNIRMQQKLNFMTAPLPVIGSQPAAWANSHCLGISRQRSDSKYTADITFIKWFFEHYATAAKVVGVIPLSSTARDSVEFTGAPQYPYYKAFISELDHVALEPTLPQYTSIFSFGKPTPLSTNLEAAIAGSKSVSQALADMKQGIDAQLAQEY